MIKTDLIDKYNNLRTLAIGSSLNLDIDYPAQSPINEDAFNTYVVSASVVLREELSDDLNFFKSLNLYSPSGVMRVIRDLRTAHAHSDDESAISFYRSWVGQPPNWETSTAALTDQINNFLETLTKIARKVYESDGGVEAWSESASISVPVIFDAVCADLNFGIFPDIVRSAKIRDIDARYKRLNANTAEKKSIITDYCVQELLSESPVLPVPYEELLDRENLIGKPAAPQLLDLAYTIARNHPALSGEQFINKVIGSWRQIKPPSPAAQMARLLRP